MAMPPRDRPISALLSRYREKRAWAVSNISLWKELCGRHTANYGTRMPENLTDHALIMGVLVS